MAAGILLESAGEQEACHALQGQARCLHPGEVKRTNFFHSCFLFFILFQTKVKAFNWFYACQIGKEEMHKCQ